MHISVNIFVLYLASEEFPEFFELSLIVKLLDLEVNRELWRRDVVLNSSYVAGVQSIFYLSLGCFISFLILFIWSLIEVSDSPQTVSGVVWETYVEEA